MENMKAIVDGDGNVLYVNKAIFDLQVHKTEDALATVSALTADAERLVQALRLCMDAMLEKGVPTHPDADARVAYTAAEEALAAHSTQAQPPAASVTDAMDAARYRWLLKTQNTDCEHHSLEDLAWYALHNLSGEETSNAIDAALAAQENK